MASPTLDRLDRQLLRLLQQDNRRPLRDLAEKLGISAPTCLRRIRRLESARFIQGHHALLDPAKLGFGVQAFVEVILVAPSGAAIAAFERRMLRCPDVVQCAELAGEVDYLLTVRARTLEEYSAFARRQLAEDRNVKSYRTLLVMRQTKLEWQVPV